MSGSPTQKAKGGGKQQEAQTSAKPAHAVQQPSAQHSEQTDGCPGTHQTRYDCNTVSAIANVRQADAAEWFNHAAVLEIGVGLVTAAAAFFAAKFARDAVTAARDTLTHEKRRSRSDLRPWITYVHHDMGNLRPGDKIDGKPVDRGLRFAMKFVNSGKTQLSPWLFSLTIGSPHLMHHGPFSRLPAQLKTRVGCSAQTFPARPSSEPKDRRPSTICLLAARVCGSIVI